MFELRNCRFVAINKYWDRTSKIIIAMVDISLNIYFILTVKRHLIKKGLLKYAPLVSFNTGLMLVSISMDVSKSLRLLDLIALMILHRS
jgi:hypothetical protein